MKAVIATIVFFLSLSSISAYGKSLFVSKESSPVFDGTGYYFNIINELKKGDEVTFLGEFNNWVAIKTNGVNGFMRKEDLLTKSPSSNDDPVTAKIEFNDSSFKYAKSYAIEYELSEFKNKPANYLRIINEDRNTDVVVKLIRMSDFFASDELIFRTILVESSSETHIRNIPEGEYYLKISYGKDWRETIVDGKFYGKFTKNALYEKGQDILNFNTVKTSKGINVPSYNLTLGLSPIQNKSNIEAVNISESDFNN